MTTDELRTAAETLRALAADAASDSGSPDWHASRHFPDQPDATYTALWATGVRTILRGGGGRGRPPGYVSAPVGDYIATMDPGVGLALADWLNQTIRACDEGHIAIPFEALAVARAVNAKAGA